MGIWRQLTCHLFRELVFGHDSPRLPVSVAAAEVWFLHKFLPF